MTPIEKIKELEKKLEEHEKRISKLEKLFRSKPQEVKKEISIRELILSKKPKSDVQKTLLIGYYLEKYRGMPFFNAKDLEEGFKESKEKVPPNINNKVYRNVKKGHMMELKKKKGELKTWNLTITGERFVENDFKE